jgi:hypothetical protein
MRGARAYRPALRGAACAGARAWYRFGFSERCPLIDVAILKLIGFSAVGALVLAWLAVSFTGGRGRMLLARSGAALLYVALGCLFIHLVQQNWEKGRIVLVVPFGFLLGVFVAGFCLTVVKLAKELGGAGPGAESATH